MVPPGLALWGRGAERSFEIVHRQEGAILVEVTSFKARALGLGELLRSLVLWRTALTNPPSGGACYPYASYRESARSAWSNAGARLGTG